MEAAFARVGITSAEDLQALGNDAAYGCLLRNGARPHFMAYCAIEMGLMGRPWGDCRDDEKTRLRARFDALVTECAASEDQAFERRLDEIGVVTRR